MTFKIAIWWESLNECCDWRHSFGFGTLAGYLLLLCISPVFTRVSTLVFSSWRAGLLFSAVIFLLLSFLVLLKRPRVLEGNRLLYLALFGELLTVFGLWYSLIADDIVSQMISASCVSFGLVLLILIWTKPFTQVRLRGRVVTTAASAIIGCLSYFLVSALPQEFSFLAGMSLSLISVFFYILLWVERGTGAEKSEQKNTLGSNKTYRGYPCEPKIVIAAIVYGCLFTLIGHIVPEAENEWIISRVPGLLNVTIFFLCSLGIGAYMIKVAKKESADVAYRPVILFMALGLAMLPFASGIGIFVCTSLSLTGFGLALVYLWISMGNTCQRYNIWPAQIYTLGIFYLILGMLFGELIVLTIVGFGFTGIHYSSAITSVGFFLLVIVLWQQASGARYANETKEMGGSEYDQSTLLIDEKVRRFAEEHHLTEREQEVLALWANGRNVPYICDELFIAKNTVKTHIKHIYEKGGVGGKQELMDVISNSSKHD